MGMTSHEGSSDLIIPKADDEVAAEIDVCVLNEPIDLTGLAEFFQQRVAAMDRPAQAMYLRYLDYITNFNYLTLIATTSIRLDEKDNVSVSQGAADGYCSSGFCNGFSIFRVSYGNGEAGHAPKLAMLFITEDGSQVGTFVEDITAIEL